DRPDASNAAASRRRACPPRCAAVRRAAADRRLAQGFRFCFRSWQRPPREIHIALRRKFTERCDRLSTGGGAKSQRVTKRGGAPPCVPCGGGCRSPLQYKRREWKPFPV